MRLHSTSSGSGGNFVEGVPQKSLFLLLMRPQSKDSLVLWRGGEEKRRGRKCLM